MVEGANLGWVSRPRQVPVTTLVLHHTAVGNEVALRILSGRDPATQVSVHYLVTDEPSPRVIAIVPEDKVAFHAGQSHWRGVRNLNECSIGIEIVNLDGNVHPYSEAQFATVARLAAEIVQRHGIAPAQVVAHSDIAPGRKLDPGSLFPWKRLAREAGIAVESITVPSQSKTTTSKRSRMAQPPQEVVAVAWQRRRQFDRRTPDRMAEPDRPGMKEHSRHARTEVPASGLPVQFKVSVFVVADYREPQVRQMHPDLVGTARLHFRVQ